MVWVLALKMTLLAITLAKSLKGVKTMSQITSENIPVIDIGQLVRGELNLQVANKLRQASHDPGFIYVCNHGIPESVTDEARNAAKLFFRQGESDKSNVIISENHRGWLASGGAVMTDGVEADLKESFVWGHDAGIDHHQAHSLQGKNQWPTQAIGFKKAAQAWLNSAERLAQILLRNIAFSLELDSNFFLRRNDNPLTRASFVYYPPRPMAVASDRATARYGVGPHTDFGVMTILCQDHIGGLQIQNTQGYWLDAPPIDGTLVVNIGDLLQRWTSGEFRSAPHRVLSPDVTDRISLVLAFDPNPESIVDAGEIFPEQRAAAEPITCGDYLDWRFDQAFHYRAADA